jgi:hypothetical protein
MGANNEEIVKKELTSSSRQDYLYSMPDVPTASDPAAAAVRETAQRLLRELAEPGAGSPLDTVAAARELSAAAAGAMQAAVDRARGAGHSWREIGDVLNTTRQAAFQRFGRPVDPRTNKPLNRSTLPGADTRAVEIFSCIIEGRWEDARRDFGPVMLEAVTAMRISAAWTLSAAQVGRYEHMGEPLVLPVNDTTLVDLPLYFEAGERTGRVVFDTGGQVIGLFIRPQEQLSG